MSALVVKALSAVSAEMSSKVISFPNSLLARAFARLLRDSTNTRKRAVSNNPPSIGKESVEPPVAKPGNSVSRDDKNWRIG